MTERTIQSPLSGKPSKGISQKPKKYQTLSLLIFSLYITGLLAILNLAFLYYGASLGYQEVSKENGIMENMQAGAYALSAIFFLVGIARKSGKQRCIKAFFCILALNFFFRELELDNVASSGVVLFFTEGMGSKVAFGIAYLLVGLLFLKGIRTQLIVIINTSREKVSFFLVLSAALLGLGEFFEDIKGTFIEELFELNGAACFLIVAIMAMTSRRDYRPYLNKGK